MYLLSSFMEAQQARGTPFEDVIMILTVNFAFVMHAQGFYHNASSAEFGSKWALF